MLVVWWDAPTLLFDAIKAKIDLVKTKTLSFLAIAGGSWIYIFKTNIPKIVKVGSVIIFVLSTLWYNIELCETEQVTCNDRGVRK